MSDAPVPPEPQQPRLTNEQVLAASVSEINPYLAWLWALAIIGGIVAAILYIFGLVPADNGYDVTTTRIISQSASKSAALAAAGNVLIASAVFAAAALALGAARWHAKVS